MKSNQWMDGKGYLESCLLPRIVRCLTLWSCVSQHRWIRSGLSTKTHIPTRSHLSRSSALKQTKPVLLGCSSQAGTKTYLKPMVEATTSMLVCKEPLLAEHSNMQMQQIFPNPRLFVLQFLYRKVWWVSAFILHASHVFQAECHDKLNF